MPNVGLEGLVRQVERLQYYPVSAAVWKTIMFEGLDGEFIPDSRRWFEAELPISTKDRELLHGLDSETIDKYNQFDILLKQRYRMRYIDLIDYSVGRIRIVKHV